MTDVVSCNIPILLSIQSMQKMSMVIEFGNDMLHVMGQKIQLRHLKSGHLALPLSI